MSQAELRKPPLEDLLKIKDNIVYGYEKVEDLLRSAAPIQIREAGPTEYFSEGPSCVWIVDKLSVELPHIVEHYKKTFDLKRILIYVLDSDDFARVVSNSRYYKFYIDPRVKFVLMDHDQPLSETVVKEAFSLTKEDRPEETKIMYSFSDERFDAEKYKQQVLRLHESVHSIYGEVHGLEWGVNTYDRFRGFENHVHNLRELLTSPDIRNWGGAAKGRPGIIIGAGPSIKEQLEFLKSVQDKAVLLAADTMLKPLTNAGIRPHLLVSLERDECIIPLLDDPNEHPESILVAANVLKPECFKVYRGPRTLFDMNYPYNKWLGFKRSQLGSGHSCVGTAMACASYIGCGDMFLMGIDLSWSPDGEAHTKDVPYHADESYKSQYDELHAKSFVKINNQGQEVRTHNYWQLFQSQFEDWIRVHPGGKVYNLSPTGVVIEGAPFTKLDSEVVKQTLSNEDKEFSKYLLSLLDYESTEKTKVALQNLIEKSQDLLHKLPDLKTACAQGERTEILQAFEANSHFEFLLSPLFKGDLRRLEDLEDFNTEEIDKVRESFKDYLPLLEELLKEASETSKILLSEDIRLFG